MTQYTLHEFGFEPKRFKIEFEKKHFKPDCAKKEFLKAWFKDILPELNEAINSSITEKWLFPNLAHRQAWKYGNEGKRYYEEITDEDIRELRGNHYGDIPYFFWNVYHFVYDYNLEKWLWNNSDPVYIKARNFIQNCQNIDKAIRPVGPAEFKLISQCKLTHMDYILVSGVYNLVYREEWGDIGHCAPGKHQGEVIASVTVRYNESSQKWLFPKTSVENRDYVVSEKLNGMGFTKSSIGMVGGKSRTIRVGKKLAEYLNEIDFKDNIRLLSTLV